MLSHVLRAIRNILTLERRDRYPLHAGVAALGLIASVLEITGIGLIFPLIVVFADPPKIASFNSLIWVRKVLSIQSDQKLLLLLAGAVVGVSLARLMVRGLFRYSQAVVTLTSGQIVAEQLLQRYMYMPYQAFARRNSGSIVRNITVLPYGPLATSLMSLVNLIVDTFVVIGLMLLMVAMQPVALGAATTVIGGLMVLIYPMLQRKNRAMGAVANELVASRVSIVQQTLGDLKLLRVLGVEEYLMRSNRRVLDQYLANSWRIQLIASLPPLMIEGTFIVGFVATVVALYVTAGGPSEMVASLALFAAAAVRLLGVSNRVMTSLTTLHRHEAGLATLINELSEDSDVPLDDARAPAALPFEREIRLNNVGFRYENREEDALVDVNLVIRKGEMIGIIGPSGSGKSTLADIILTILAPSAGSMTVDGVDVASLPARWRRNLAYVPQRVAVFNDSVMRNVAYGLRAQDIDETCVWTALRAAQLEADVKALPHGIQTTLGEGGTNLSGGQLQRLGIARALYYDRPVVLFDEVTSALDSETEKALTCALDTLKASHTLITVSHRMSTLRFCDRIIVMRKGRIVDEGPFDVIVRDEATLTAAEISPDEPEPAREFARTLAQR